MALMQCDGRLYEKKRLRQGNEKRDHGRMQRERDPLKSQGEKKASALEVAGASRC